MDKTIYVDLWLTDWTAVALIICVIINNIIFYFAKDIKKHIAQKWKDKNKKKVGFIQDGQ